MIRKSIISYYILLPVPPRSGCVLVHFGSFYVAKNPENKNTFDLESQGRSSHISWFPQKRPIIENNSMKQKDHCSWAKTMVSMFLVWCCVPCFPRFSQVPGLSNPPPHQALGGRGPAEDVGGQECPAFETHDVPEEERPVEAFEAHGFGCCGVRTVLLGVVLMCFLFGFLKETCFFVKFLLFKKNNMFVESCFVGLLGLEWVRIGG